MKYGIEAKSRSFVGRGEPPKDIESQQMNLASPSDGQDVPFRMSKKLLAVLIASVAGCALAAGIAFGASGAVSSHHRAKATNEQLHVGTGLYAPPPSSPSTMSSSTGFCWACDEDHGSREGSWWFGWGACVCDEGWKGSCCSEPSLNIDDAWRQYLETPPNEVKNLAMTLEKEADDLAATFGSMAVDLSDIDVVVSGGGNLDAFWMGASMILSRISSANVKRQAGVSAGGMMPFEIALKGELNTLESHLSYGIITRDYKDWFANALSAASWQDHHWRIMADWQTNKYSASLSNRLDRKIHLGTSCLKPFPTLVIIDEYTAADDQATHAFMSTGTFLEMYDGYICSDGGATSGPKMTPLFQDDLRPQLIVDLMLTGFPTSMVYDASIEQYMSLIRVGMQEMVRFATTGTTERSDIITLCPTGSDVSGNICLPSS
mmetsp:Transcript_2898/g.6099  ORF Transcript_2898/g.6099 Transcript_2898/m.6099 type:complete len:433 (+) Transcript_2898:69-1367(+)